MDQQESHFAVTVRKLGGEARVLNVSGIATARDLMELLEKEHGMRQHTIALYREGRPVGNDATFTCACELDLLNDDLEEAPFTIKGAEGYAAAINGTYVPTDERHNSKLVFRQIERPEWRFKYCKPDIFAVLRSEEFVRAQHRKQPAPKEPLQKLSANMYTSSTNFEDEREAAITADLAPMVNVVLQQVHPGTKLGADAMHMISVRYLKRSFRLILDAAIAASSPTPDDSLGDDARAGTSVAVSVSAASLESALAEVLHGGLAKHSLSEVKEKIKQSKGESTARRCPLVFDPSLMSRMAAPTKLDETETARVHVGIAAALEYLCAELLELAGNAARDRLSDALSYEEFQEWLKDPCEELVRRWNRQTARASTGGIAPRMQLASSVARASAAGAARTTGSGWRWQTGSRDHIDRSKNERALEHVQKELNRLRRLEREEEEEKERKRERKRKEQGANGEQPAEEQEDEEDRCLIVGADIVLAVENDEELLKLALLSESATDRPTPPDTKLRPSEERRAKLATLRRTIQDKVERWKEAEEFETWLEETHDEQWYEGNEVIEGEKALEHVQEELDRLWQIQQKKEEEEEGVSNLRASEARQAELEKLRQTVKDKVKLWTEPWLKAEGAGGSYEGWVALGVAHPRDDRAIRKSSSYSPRGSFVASRVRELEDSSD
eukprot:g2774.t1